jgi:tetratricopeptide (TPR) repeat protein
MIESLARLGFPGFFLVVLVAVVVADVIWFIVLPTILARRSLGSPRICRYLEWVAATPSLFGEFSKIWVRHDLLRMYNHHGNAQRALEHGERLLNCKLPPDFETEVRTRVADALETLGRLDEARLERNRAKAHLETEPIDAAWHMSQGRLLKSQNDFRGACEAYQSALDRTTAENAASRAFALLSLSLAEFHCGLVADSLPHAEEAASLAQDAKIRLLALRQASMGHATLGHIQESEHFDRTVCELARHRGDRKTLAESSAHLAENLRKRRQLDEALQALEEVRAEAGEIRQYHSIRYEALRSAGRFEEALQAIQDAGRVDPLGLGRAENKVQGIRDFGAARLLIELGRIDEASARLAQASEALKNDQKLAFWCRSAEARLRAIQGRKDDALRLMERVEAEVNQYAGDRNTQLVALSNLGRAAEALGVFERGFTYWQAYLAAPPNPVDEPTAHFHLGECRRGRGDLSSARQYYEEAAGLGLTTHESHLARQRLRES